MKVMIIEDEPVIRYALVKMVGNLGVKGFEPNILTEVEYAENAIEYFEDTDYDMVFVDIEGGELNGLDLINQWRNKRRHTQWIIISGYDRFEYAQRAILYGVQEYLLKPITKEKLSISVNRCVEKMFETSNDFIGPDKIKNLITKLEEAIWKLDYVTVKDIVNQWSNEISRSHLSISYYNNVLDYILKELFSRIKNRGTLLQENKWEINLKTKEQSNRMFVNECLKMTQLIKEVRRGREIDPIEIAKNYILEHIDQDISLEDVANKLGFNASYFSQIFKQKTGETFVKYRTNLRMERAKDILLRHDVRVIDIPFMIGLNDHPHFTKTFKEHTGFTPSGYRREMGIS